jgi:hypothetical protein
MKTTLPLPLAAVLSLAFAPLALADLNHLRYEWSESPGGPFGPVPREMLKVHADGTATVESTESRRYFQLQFAGDSGGKAGATVPIRPLSSVPEATLEMLRRFIIAIAEDGSGEGADWKNATIAPFVTPICSAWNTTGEPDLVELKITGPCDTVPPDGIFAGAEGARRSPDRGFILTSLSRKSPPVVGYATDGRTQCESLLASCQDKRVRCIRRFGPMFLAAEDEDGNLVGHEGLLPVIYPDQAYLDLSRPVSYSWDSGVRDNPPLPQPPPRTLPETFASYRHLLEAYTLIPCIKTRREQREALIEFDWLAMEGRAPTLAIGVGELKTFLEDESFASFSLDDEDGRGAVVTVTRAVPGVTITGLVPGAHRLTLFPENGVPRRYLIVVSPSVAPRGGGQTGVFTSSQVWETTGGKDGQPRFDQRSDLERWCDAVGCGPTMIAMQIAWAEHNQNVPSAYWDRSPSSTLNSRRQSLREINAPLEYIEGSPGGSMRYWYDYLHDACNVACWPHNGSGSAVPWDVGGAMGNYVDYACSHLMPLTLVADPGGPLVGGYWSWTNDGWGDDWDEAGKMVANAIKAGRPGGVYYMEHWHYCVAWRYRKNVTKIMINGNVIQSWTQRLFRVNTGWGNQDRVWNAYDIDGCFLMDLWQMRQLANP